MIVIYNSKYLGAPRTVPGGPNREGGARPRRAVRAAAEVAALVVAWCYGATEQVRRLAVAVYQQLRPLAPQHPLLLPVDDDARGEASVPGRPTAERNEMISSQDPVSVYIVS